MRYVILCLYDNTVTYYYGSFRETIVTCKSITDAKVFRERDAKNERIKLARYPAEGMTFRLEEIPSYEVFYHTRRKILPAIPKGRSYLQQKIREERRLGAVGKAERMGFIHRS